MQEIAAEVGGRIWSSREIKSDFEVLCACGGRFAGSESESRACALLKERVAAIAGHTPEIHAVDYDGWSRRVASLERLAPALASFPCDSLVWSPPTPADGIEAEVVDLGRGTEESFVAHEDEIAGRIVIVRHEYMFAAGHIHRRRKIAWARDRGAKAILVANYRPNAGIVTGSGWNAPEGAIPAVGISHETAAALGMQAGVRARARLVVEVAREPRTAENLIVEFPGEIDEWVVLSAHYDGHHLAESAIDNASGVASALAVAQAITSRPGRMRRGLRLCLFSIEEWALTGSRLYVARLPEEVRRRTVLNVNLDAVAGAGKLTALTSGFQKVEAFVREATGELGIELGYYRPMMPNSDHLNFADAGIPALRFASGFDQPPIDSFMHNVLTPGDTRDKVSALELKMAALVASAVVVRALDAQSIELRT